MLEHTTEGVQCGNLFVFSREHFGEHTTEEKLPCLVFIRNVDSCSQAFIKCSFMNFLPFHNGKRNRNSNEWADRVLLFFMCILLFLHVFFLKITNVSIQLFCVFTKLGPSLRHLILSVGLITQVNVVRVFVFHSWNNGKQPGWFS